MESLTKMVLKGVSFVVNTPLVAILFSIPVFLYGIKVFRRGLKIKSSEDNTSFKSLGTGIGLFILSIMLIVNAILTLTDK